MGGCTRFYFKSCNSESLEAQHMDLGDTVTDLESELGYVQSSVGTWRLISGWR